MKATLVDRQEHHQLSTQTARPRVMSLLYTSEISLQQEASLQDWPL